MSDNVSMPPAEKLLEVTATCFVAECENAGYPIALLTAAGAKVICGVCGQTIIEQVPVDAGFDAE